MKKQEKIFKFQYFSFYEQHEISYSVQGQIQDFWIESSDV